LSFPKNAKAHYDLVASLGCILTGAPATIHHVHGRSIGARLVTLGMPSVKGMSRRGYGDALVIPLSAELHYLGSKSIDGGGGVERWEHRWQVTQDVLVDRVSERLEYDLWELHRLWSGNPKSNVRSGTT
jgi:hypothetical protein